MFSKQFKFTDNQIELENSNEFILQAYQCFRPEGQPHLLLACSFVENLENQIDKDLKNYRSKLKIFALKEGSQYACIHNLDQEKEILQFMFAPRYNALFALQGKYSFLKQINRAANELSISQETDLKNVDYFVYENKISCITIKGDAQIKAEEIFTQTASNITCFALSISQDKMILGYDNSKIKVLRLKQLG